MAEGWLGLWWLQLVGAAGWGGGVEERRRVKRRVEERVREKGGQFSQPRGYLPTGWAEKREKREKEGGRDPIGVCQVDESFWEVPKPYWLVLELPTWVFNPLFIQISQLGSYFRFGSNCTKKT